MLLYHVDKCLTFHVIPPVMCSEDNDYPNRRKLVYSTQVDYHDPSEKDNGPPALDYEQSRQQLHPPGKVVTKICFVQQEQQRAPVGHLQLCGSEEPLMVTSCIPCRCHQCSLPQRHRISGIMDALLDRGCHSKHSCGSCT